MLIYTYLWPGNGIRPSFGNNLFCYFTSKIIIKECGHSCVDSIDLLGEDYITIGDTEWNLFFELKESWKNKNIYLYGFFQDSNVIEKYRLFIKSLITNNNTDVVTPPTEKCIKICDIFNIKLDFKPLKSDIVLHIRLDDFKHHGGITSEIIDPGSYFDILDNISNKSRIIIVVDKPKNDFEYSYIDSFKKRFRDLEVIVQSSFFLTDFVFLINSNRIIVSNSTFSWIAGFLGNSDENYILRNTYHVNQNLLAISEKSVIYPIKYLPV